MKKTILILSGMMIAGAASAALLSVTDWARIQGGTNSSVVDAQPGTLALKNAGANNTYTRMGIMKIDLSSMTANAATASFSIHAKNDAAFNLNIYGVSSTAANQAWSSSTVTWDNVGMFDPANYGTDPNLTLIGSGNYTGADSSNPATTASGSSLVNLINANRNAGHQSMSFLIAIDANVNALVRTPSSVGLEPALNYTAVPEPATIGLVGISGLFMFVANRRMKKKQEEQEA